MDISNKSISLLRKHNIAFDESLLALDQYETGFVEPPKKNIMVEAKRLILKEQFDRIVNFELCELYNQKPEKQIKCCKEKLECEAIIWEDVPAPNTSLHIFKNSIDNRKNITEALNKELFNKLGRIREKHEKEAKINFIATKYFKIWRNKVKMKNKNKVENNLITDEKIDNFFKRLKKRKEETERHKRKTSEKKKRKTPINKIPIEKDSEVYENRYKAQKSIILMQKSKLLEQEQLIQELKHGKISKELSASIEETKNDMKELLTMCSKRTKRKLIPVVEKIEDQIEVKVNQAPKLVREMEKRAIERAFKRQIIQERKRILDEERKKLAEELVEKKRIQDEEEKRKNLEVIKERRRKELEMEKQRQINKQKFLAVCLKAEEFYKIKLKRLVFRMLKKMIKIKAENEYKGEIFYEATIERSYFIKWREFTRERKCLEMVKAVEFCELKVLKRCFCVFRELLKRAKQNYQVAVDFYDLQLLSKSFKQYQMYVCKEKMRRYNLYMKAINHYKNRLLVQYFYQWRCLPAVLKLEKAKEEKKRKWREKVMEVLPDYRPPIDDYY